MGDGAECDYTLKTICIQTTFTRHLPATLAAEAGWAGRLAGDSRRQRFPGA